MDEDPFDSILGLEDQFYEEGYAQGEEDGKRTGLIEGRQFGLTHGFDKFIEMGKLHGRSVVWASRLPHSPSNPLNGSPQDLSIKQTDPCAAPTATSGTSLQSHSSFDPAISKSPLPLLPRGPRIEKHVRVFHALTELESISTENTEEALADYEDRLKRALGKAKIIEKLIGEQSVVSATSSTKTSQARANDDGDANIEDANILHARH